MNGKAAVCVIVAISLGNGGLAFAQGREDRNDRNDRGRDEQGQPRGQQVQPRDHDQQDRRAPEARQPSRPQYEGRAQNRYGERRDERGAGPYHQYYRGDRLPVEYRHRNYVVDDWREHRLSAPPRGYHWVQVGADYVLVAIATGIILQLLLSN